MKLVCFQMSLIVSNRGPKERRILKIGSKIKKIVRFLSQNDRSISKHCVRLLYFGIKLVFPFIYRICVQIMSSKKTKNSLLSKSDY